MSSPSQLATVEIRAAAELLLQVNTANCLQEAEDLLQTLVAVLQKRYGHEHPFVKRAAFLLEEVGRDAEEWRFHSLGAEEEADSAAMFSVEQGLHPSLAGEDEDWEGWEEVTEP